MYPYLNIGSFHLGTFGLLLWLAAVAGTYVLHRNFQRNGVDADALNVVALVVICGVIGAKLWHELQNIPDLKVAWHEILAPGMHHPGDVVMSFLHWFQAGFAWYGGLLAGIAMLMFQGTQARFKAAGWTAEAPVLGRRIGPIRMLDLAAPATAVGYGIGRIGCLTSGDGDYGRNTTSHFWGVHMAKNALVRPTPADALVLNTPLWEFLIALVLGWILWKLGTSHRVVGWMTGMYLALSGAARFFIEFYRINPKLYFGHTMSNAQVAALGSVFVGIVLIGIAKAWNVQWPPAIADESLS